MNINNYQTRDSNLCNNPPRLTQASNRPSTTTGFNQGISSNLRYDEDYLQDALSQSTGPIKSQMDANRIRNCKQCLSTNGPRASQNGWGASLPIQNAGIAPAQQVVDIDSIMKNLNTKSSRSSKGGLNEIDVFKFKTYGNEGCNKFLDPVSLQLTQPRTLAREKSINRFYDLNKNPQKHIFYNFSENTTLTAKDNFYTPYPANINNTQNLPQPTQNMTQKQPPHYKMCNVQVFDEKMYPKVNRIINPDLVESESDNSSNESN